MSLCDQCIEGVRHEGTPEGSYETIAGVKTYVATPEGEYAKDKGVLFFTDACGLELNNNPLLIDSIAKNGFKVYAPDLFEGDPAPMIIHDDVVALSKFDFAPWLARHSLAHNAPRVQGVMRALKEQGITKLAATGYCYGGRVIFDLVFDTDLLDVAAVSHPSLLSVEDLEKYASTVKVPLLINSCEIDPQFDAEKQKKADELFKDFAPGYRREYFEGCTHGFAVRGDMSNPKIKAGKEGAFKSTVEWFQKYL